APTDSGGARHPARGVGVRTGTRTTVRSGPHGQHAAAQSGRFPGSTVRSIEDAAASGVTQNHGAPTPDISAARYAFVPSGADRFFPRADEDAPAPEAAPALEG